MTPPLFATQNLTKTFTGAGATPVHALVDVDLQIQPGEFTVLMGSSGSGKSTLLYLLSGLARKSEGEIHFQDRRIDDLDEAELSILRRSGIGFVFQAIHLIPHLTLFENVAIPGYLLDRDRRRVGERARGLLEQLGVGELAERLPAQASGGEQQRAAIARALINEPEVLLADEPTGALNSSASLNVLDALADVHASGRTVVMATHEVRAACYGSRILYLRDGRVLSEYRHADPEGDVEAREAALVSWLTDQGW